MLNNRIVRLSVGLPGAAFIVFGLYQFMSEMIDTDFVPPEMTKRGMIEAIPLPSGDDTKPQSGHDRPEELELAERPPPPPAYAAGDTVIDLPTPVLEGAVPEIMDIGRLMASNVAPPSIPDRHAKPLTPPNVIYPRDLAARGVEGRCEVRLDVGTRGTPYDVEASCSHPGFEREAERAVRRVRFVPEVINGQARARHNVVYPIEFKLGEN